MGSTTQHTLPSGFFTSHEPLRATEAPPPLYASAADGVAFPLCFTCGRPLAFLRAFQSEQALRRVEMGTDGFNLAELVDEVGNPCGDVLTALRVRKACCRATYLAQPYFDLSPFPSPLPAVANTCFRQHRAYPITLDPDHLLPAEAVAEESAAAENAPWSTAMLRQRILGLVPDKEAFDFTVQD